MNMARAKTGESGRCLIIDGLVHKAKNYLDLILKQTGITKKFQRCNYYTVTFQRHHSGDGPWVRGDKIRGSRALSLLSQPTSDPSSFLSEPQFC